MKRSEHSAVQSKCPLWVKSRHVQRKSRCPLCPQERTFSILCSHPINQRRIIRHRE